MNIQITEQTIRIAIVAPRDRVDAFNAPELRGRLDDLLAGGVTRFVLDLSDVPFLDSAGMAVLVSLLKRARTAGGEVKLVMPKSDAAQRILRLTRFDKVFPLADSAETAIRIE